MEGQQRYDSFVQSFRGANPYLNKQTQFLEAQKTWNNLKTEPEKLSPKMNEYKAKAAEFKSNSLITLLVKNVQCNSGKKE